ncbi:hypothetical protein KFE25_005911 [Diacronema lutheri]|uniref:J domain-containing protein n=1 Tax=Diacronema lutheri TaxID=2081491 RepID=A0A8J5XUY4_DIALT|nr:hypothetical protein KFE25_005911 [Diacronema lutheri]
MLQAAPVNSAARHRQLVRHVHVGRAAGARIDLTLDGPCALVELHRRVAARAAWWPAEISALEEIFAAVDEIEEIDLVAVPQLAFASMPPAPPSPWPPRPRETPPLSARRRRRAAASPLAPPSNLASVQRALEAELAALKRASRDAFTLLAHIYARHPPRVPRPHVPSDVRAHNVKKAVLNALRDYHPDRCTSAGDDAWFLLCCEITKALNDRHDVLRNA